MRAEEGSVTMQQDFLVESRSYDQGLRGSWRTYRLNEGMQLGDEQAPEESNDLLRLWLPVGTLIHTYAAIIQPATIELDRLSYIDLDLSVLVKPDLSYEVLTQAEFEQMADLFHYDEETRIGALMALRTLTSTIQHSVGVFTAVPSRLQQSDFHLVHCGN